MTSTRSKVARFIFDNSLLLLAGTAAAVVWANLDVSSYDRLADPLHFWVNDLGMAFFFALAAKEVFEATLPGGPSIRKADWNRALFSRGAICWRASSTGTSPRRPSGSRCRRVDRVHGIPLLCHRSLSRRTSSG
jgi:hypothetical protein